MPLIEIPYAPREHQRSIHANLKRFNVLVCHRRFGKTVLAINEIIKQALTCKLKNPRYAYLAPQYKQAKAVAWDYVKFYTRPIPGVNYNESELRCDLPNGASIKLLGADNPDALRGIYLDGVVMDEVAQMPPKAWSEVIRPALTDRKGWAIFIGTPKGQNAFYDMYQLSLREPDWFGACFKASDTGIIPQNELDAVRREGMSDDEYEQEFECSFTAAIMGAYYGKEMAAAEKDGRITIVPHDPLYPVDTTWDLGLDGHMAIICVQTVGLQHRAIDYVTGVGAVPEAVGELQSKGYTWGRHYLPHDAEPKQIGSGVSIKETIESLGLRTTVVVPQGRVEDGINAVRMMLPKFVWDSKKCAELVKAMQHYQRDWDYEKNTFKPKPKHDWASHPADAARTYAMGYQPFAPESVNYRALYG